MKKQYILHELGYQPNLLEDKMSMKEARTYIKTLVRIECEACRRRFKKAYRIKHSPLSYEIKQSKHATHAWAYLTLKEV